MSGGSFDYLYQKEIEQLMADDTMLQAMADRLAELGYANDAATETQNFLLTLRQFANRMNTMRQRLGEVWYAMEWWQSGDYDEEGLKNALAVYRGEAKK